MSEADQNLVMEEGDSNSAPKPDCTLGLPAAAASDVSLMPKLTNLHWEPISNDKLKHSIWADLSHSPTPKSPTPRARSSVSPKVHNTRSTVPKAKTPSVLQTHEMSQLTAMFSRKEKLSGKRSTAASATDKIESSDKSKKSRVNACVVIDTARYIPAGCI